MASQVPVNNETVARLTRTTSDGRELFYNLRVIQQPEQARACGSGAKSSADRRPVDPPPVVELKIYEGEDKKDVTFSYNANFFLFTTLEASRKIAHGRVTQTPAMAPVLTGAPVAGMVYLDRPTPAGYFIFPDLSVRHEGNYRLSFSLYEDVKEAKDADQTPAPCITRSTGNPMAPRAHVHFRMDVRSESFHVYSAKKFPGLTNSTMLSKAVAEQGCRVRIRRDIRVRRREKKVTDNYHDAGEQGPYGTSEQYATPQHMPDRPRSISHGSGDARAPYHLQRQPSLETAGYFPSSSYATGQPLAPPHTTASVYSSTPHNYNGSSTPTYQTPTYHPKPSIQNSPLPPPPPSQQYPPPANISQYPATFSHSRQMSAPYTYSHPSSQQSQPMYGLPQTPKEEYQPTPELRKASIGMSRNQEPHHQIPNSRVGYPPVYKQHDPTSRNTANNRDERSLTPINTTPHIGGHNIPSLTNVLDVPSMHHNDMPPSPTTNPSGMPMGPRNPYDSMSFFSVANATVNPQSSTATSYQPLSASSSKPSSSTMPTPITSESSKTHKRAFGQSFDTSHFTAPQHSGMRPNADTIAHDIPAIESDDDTVPSAYGQLGETLRYKRANGSTQRKQCLIRSPPRAPDRRMC